MTLPLRALRTRGGALRPLAGLLACLLLGSCAGSTGSAGAGTGGTSAAEARVEVDTPALRQLKHAAGVEPCVPGSGGARDGAPAGGRPLGRHEPGQLLDGDLLGRAPHRLQPRGQRNGRLAGHGVSLPTGPCLPGQAGTSTPRCSRTSARSCG